MLLELLIALLLGCLAGTFTGLAPGIHINLIATILLSSISSIPHSNPLSLVIFIISMSITHTFLDFIPSIYLGAPEEDTFLSILPGHEMLIEGKAHEAIVIIFLGCSFAILLTLITTPLFLIELKNVYSLISTAMPFLLIFLSIYIIFRDKSILNGLIIFILSGILGFFTFQLPLNQPLLPLLSGLFGLSNLIFSLKNKSSHFPQKIIPFKQITLSKNELKKSFLGALFVPLFSFLPGIGSGHATTFSSEIVEQSRKGFLFLNGVSSTLIMSLSFIIVYAIGKSRSGTADAIYQLIPNTSTNLILVILSSIVISAIIAFTLGITISKLFANNLTKINYKKLTLLVIIILIIINIYFSGIYGLLVLIASTLLGLHALQSDTRRINLMGSLIVPTIINYLFN